MTALDTYKQTGAAPVSELGKLVLNYAESVLNVELPGPSGAGGCNAAEPQFLRSLDLLGVSPKDDRKAIVYIDDEGKPVGYRKHRGDPTTLIIDKPSEKPDLMVGEIIVTADGAFPGSEYKVLSDFRSPTQQVDFLRFPDVTDSGPTRSRPSLFSLTAQYRKRIGYTAPNVATYALLPYASYVPSVSNIAISDIHEQVTQLTADAIS